MSRSDTPSRRIVEDLQRVAAAVKSSADLTLVDALFERGDHELVAEELKQIVAGLGLSDPELWSALGRVFQALEFEDDADECQLLGRLLGGEIASPYERLSRAARAAIEASGGDDIGDVSVLDDLSATFLQATWDEALPLGALVVFAEVLNGDVWVVDTAQDEAVFVLSHDLVFEEQVSDPRDALTQVGASVEEALARWRDA